MPDSVYKTRRRFEHRQHARLINFTCYHNQDFLRSERTCTWLIQAIERARSIHGFGLLAYCIMPNHIHLLIFPRGTLPPILTSIKQPVANRAIHWVKTNAPTFLPAMSHKKPDGRIVHRFWQRGGGYDRNLWTPRHIWKAIDYIHMNPVEAGLCEKPEDWQWSSARYFTRQRTGPIRIDLDCLPSQP